MALILNIETATKNCSVSLSDKGKILALQELNDGGYSHGENLHLFIDNITKKVNKTMASLDAIAVSMGPGSFTGLRIGVSAAKGLCFSLGKPLISTSTLAGLARAISEKNGTHIVPLLDARRMEVYSAVFDQNYTEVRETRAEIISENSFENFLAKGEVHFLGDGAEKCKSIIKHKNAIFLDGYFPSAREMAKLSYAKYQNKEFENVAYFEPFYLKDFLITKSKK